MAKYFVLFLLLVNLLNLLILPVYGANVLAVLPSVWKSHYLFGRRLLQELVAQQQNHSVTLISPHALDAELDDVSEFELQSIANIREIRIEGLMKNWLDMGLSFNIEEIRQKSIMERFTRLIYAGTTNVDLLLADAQVRKLLRSGERFDLLIVDVFLSDALLGLAHYYQIPTVALSPNGANTWLNQMFGNPQSSALDPSNFLPYSESMNIWQRCINTLMGLFEKLTYNFFHMISQQAVYQKHFQPLCQLANASCSIPHHRELTKNLSLALINSHATVQYPRAYLPNMLEIAGAHLKAANQLKLPNHLRDFIENSPTAVVYMSLGANMRSADLSREKLEVFLDVFAYLEPMRFLFKWELEKFIGDLPKNVMLAEWWPQEAILAHPKVQAFISSAGLMSTIEAINSSTPILAIPIFPEQEVTARRLEAKGVALTINYDAITYDVLLYGIQQLTQNISYANSMQHLRQLFNASFGTPLAQTLHYIDLVLKTSGGGAHLKSHANQLNFVRSELVDVLAIIIVGLSCIIAVPFFVTCCILRKSYYSQAQAANYRVPLNTLRRSSSFGGADSSTTALQFNGADGMKCCRRTSTSASSSSLSTTSSGGGSPTGNKQKHEFFI